jgi:hypothetical protein
MKIAGKEWNGAPPLTVGALKKWIAEAEKRIGSSLDDNLVHFLQMEGPESGDDHSSYATHVELDCFDTDTGDTDGKAIPVLGLTHWPNRNKKTEAFLTGVESGDRGGEP